MIDSTPKSFFNRSENLFSPLHMIKGRLRYLSMLVVLVTPKIEEMDCLSFGECLS